MIAKRKSIRLASALFVLMLGLSGCQFQPLYGSPDGAVGPNSVEMSGLYVTEVDTRQAQQVRNHLIFLLSGGASPENATHDVKLRVTSTATTLAAAVVSTSTATSQLGNTAGSIRVRVSYEIYDKSKNEIVFRGTRETSASYDKTSQSFATERAKRDAENRAARAVAKQVRLAIASDFNRS